MLRSVSTCLAVLATLWAANVASAQPSQTGTIAGVVQDVSGGVLPGVTVTATSQERGTVRTAVTDENGRYVFASMAIGNYTIDANLSGFAPVKLTDNLVETEKTTSVPVELKVGGLTDAVTVTGETPIVDLTNVTGNTRIRREEFERLPVGRSYQSLIIASPGVVGGTQLTGSANVNALGAPNNANLYIMDSVDTTDPTTGTFGANLNFEAIQEVSVSTSAVSVEYGRGQGAIVNVITKSGTNRFEGSAKYIIVNDNWDKQQSTVNEVTGASNARVKFDKVNPAYALTFGGPIWRNKAWFFGAYEYATNTTPRRQTSGPIPEDYQQSTENNFLNVRGTYQIADGHQAWLKYFRSPTDGFVIDYWGNAGELEALTSQNQSSNSWAAQWNGVISGNWVVEAAAGTYSSRIDVTTFEGGRIGSNAPVLSQIDNRNYNGSAFDGFVDRPRQQANVASTWFFNLGSRSHNVKAGVDYQTVESGAKFDFPNSQYYIAESFNQAAGTFVPQFRRDYQSGPSTSKGKNIAIFARDKFDLTSKIFVEAGFRFEKQTGTSDLGADTVDTSVIAPRVSASYNVTGDGKTIVTGSYGRFYTGIIQSFSDGFAGVPQQANYDNFAWNGSTYVLQNQVRVGGSSFVPNPDLKPSYLDEFTLGVQRQFGRNMAVGVRVVARKWGDLIDDVRSINPDLSIRREVVNYDPAERKYRGAIFTFEKRFASNWNLLASYAYSKTEGNHFDATFTTLGDYIDAQCRTTVDPTVGAGGVIPCAEVQNGANKYGRPIYDRPHNMKLNGAYVRTFGKFNLAAGALFESASKRRYEKVRPVNVLTPGTLNNFGPTATYFYNERGSDPVPGLQWTLDNSVEVTWQGPQRTQVGFKGEVFNVTNQEAKIISNNTAFCGTTANAGCATAVANYGKAGARGSFQTPRTFRMSAIFRF
jgi:Carboxypeptidase regulatory-like domain/TonB-dependent Receptor Plug Domain